MRSSGSSGGLIGRSRSSSGGRARPEVASRPIHRRAPGDSSRGGNAPKTAANVARTAAARSSADEVLQAFWYSRGVFDGDSREKLVGLSKRLLLDQQRVAGEDESGRARAAGRGGGGGGGPGSQVLSLLGPTPFASDAPSRPPSSLSSSSSSPDLYGGGGGAAVWDDFYAGASAGGAFAPAPAVALPDSGLPGISAAWSLGGQAGGEAGGDGDGGGNGGGAAAVREASRHLLMLHALLGGREGGADVVHMVSREPGLLAADPAVLAARLLRLRVAVARLAERRVGGAEAGAEEGGAAAGASAAGAAAAAAGTTGRRSFAAPWEQQQPEQAADAGGGDVHQQAARPTQQKQQRRKDMQALLPLPPAIAAPAGLVPKPGRAAAEAVAAQARAAREWARAGAAGAPDAVRLVVRQPALLLSPLLDAGSGGGVGVEGDGFAGGGGGGGESKSDGAAARERLLLAAWEFGLARDADAEWQERFCELEAYRARHGDCGAGFRDDGGGGRGGDGSGGGGGGGCGELGRWCALQRALAARGTLPEERRAALAAAGFIFDAEEAEWRRWFLALARFRERHGHSSPGGLTLAAMGGLAGAGEGAVGGSEGGGGGGDGGGETLYLANWCSVQRVAWRCGVLAGSRERMLLGLEFDFSGADPLS